MFIVVFNNVLNFSSKVWLMNYPTDHVLYRLDGSLTDSGAEFSDHELSTSYDILPDMGYG